MAPPDTARRKQLRRDYKQTPKRMGAYSILNTKNAKRFVGVSRDLEARLNRHRFELKTKSERDLPDLQADYDKFGFEAFEFSVLEEIEPPEAVHDYDPEDDLLALELVWLDEFNCVDPDGYNKPQ